MNLDDFAHTILFGTSLEDKFVDLSSITLLPPAPPSGFGQPPGPELRLVSRPLLTVPKFPGRPLALSRPGKAKFPSLDKLHLPTVRGEVLHFFANHELLAMELMALVLLRFPEAPESFRTGIAGIIAEEQSHLRLYLTRMQELGVEFGDLPVSDYFWNCMSELKSPLEFVIQMSLTFEQANLDFSYFFMNEIQKVGDDPTAAVLRRVYEEEIGHVKHGVVWFNRWRERTTEESDWDAYVRMLPPPMTPRRAKGFNFCADARRQTGLSEKFIRELELYTGSKGRPPVLWFYNPHCDSEIARGKPGFTATAGARRFTEDLAHIPIFLSLDQDVVILTQRPRLDWIGYLQKCGFQTPEFLEYKNPTDITRDLRAPKIGGIQPWGWSPEVFEIFRPLESRLVEIAGGNGRWCQQNFHAKDDVDTEPTVYATTGLAGFGKFFAKTWSVEFLRQWFKDHPEANPLFGGIETVGDLFTDASAAKARVIALLQIDACAMVKAPYGTSGRQVRRIQSVSELGGPAGGWIENTIAQQGGIVVERALNKLCDLSIQMVVTGQKIQILEARKFITGKQNEYRGTYLGSKLQGFAPDELRFVQLILADWRNLVRDLGYRLQKAGYQGPAGVDALLWRNDKNELRIKPVVELNPRWTMGRVALELEKHLMPGVSAVWAFIPIREIKALGFADAHTYAQELDKTYPLVRKKNQILSGVVFTNDPLPAQEVLTVLATLPNPHVERFVNI
jgi:uncharacterized ferritin-like protein (DUF455 family)